MERGRSPLVSISALAGLDFQGIRVYRSDVFLSRARKANFRARHRLDEPTKLSLGAVASQHRRLPFHPISSFYFRLTMAAIIPEHFLVMEEETMKCHNRIASRTEPDAENGSLQTIATGVRARSRNHQRGSAKVQPSSADSSCSIEQ